MISVNDAIELVKQHQYTAIPVNKPIADCLNYTLAVDINSPISMPPFRQSAMDGYAICIGASNNYLLKGEIKAGDSPFLELAKGDAVRIFTGAAVPATANAVIMQEKTETSKNVVSILEKKVEIEQNIRPKGEQIEANELAITKNTVLTPTILSFLASLGIAELKVYPKPNVGIVITGSELITPGLPLELGKIYESNSILLSSTLQKEGVNNFTIYKVKDDYDNTKEILDKVISKNDFVLVSGGISVGDYDFVGKALKALGTQEIFYKVKQKPGKPLFFGKNKQTYVFALPGNPASALTCFYIYALPMLRSFSKHKEVHLKRITTKLSHNYKVKGVRSQFLKACYKDKEIKILNLQSSAMIHGFNNANSFVYIPENTEYLDKGTDVTAIILN